MIQSLLPCLLLLPSPAQDTASVDLLEHGLAHWEGQDGYWRMEDGVLVGESTPERPLERSTYLVWTGGEVADFELELEFRITGGNSGIQFRSRRGPGFAVSGYQADLEDGPNWTGGLYEQDGRGVVCRRGQSVVLEPGGAKVATALPGAEALEEIVRGGEWNRYRVRAVGQRIELALNGETSAVIEDRDPDRRSLAGVLALQLHQGPPMRIEYRDLRLTHLGGQAGPARPEWIWADVEPADSQYVQALHEFELDRDASRAVLRGAGDNFLRVALDGERVAVAREWSAPFRVELGPLAAGPHRLEALARNDGGPAGLWVELTLETDSGTRTVRSDGSWRARAGSPGSWPSGQGADWPAARSLGELGVGPWGLPTAESDGREEEALPAERLELLPGFRAERLYSVPRETQGSWVVMTFDPQGRLVVGDQYGALYRATPPAPGRTLEQVERLPLELGHAQGLLYALGDLYVTVALGQGIGLYRVRDLDGDGEHESPELLMSLRNGGEHGPHAVRLGPDGKLWLIAGNHVPLPEGMAPGAVPAVWDEDQLLPPRNDPRGHAVGMKAPAGWICRMDPDGSNPELVAIGMRNAYDFDFSPEGEVFTFDSDMEWDVGLPWYRPTRILHLVPGADFGWRTGSGKWPAHYPDSLPAVVDIGLSSPTGVEFGTAAAFHGPYRRALYCADWAYGTIYAVHLEEDGATYTGGYEVFARGKPFPVTDLAVGPDGALYVTTGGRRTQSGLYRITSELEPAERPRPQRPHARGQRRREIEVGSPRPVWDLLGLPDRFLAHAARTRLEQEALAAEGAHPWAERALGEEHPLAAVRALLGLVRTSGEHSRDVRARLAQLPVWEAGRVELLPALRVLGLSAIRGEAFTAQEAEAWSRRLEALFPTDEEHLDRELFRLLVHLRSPAAARFGVERMTRGGVSQEDSIFYAFHLRTLDVGWTLPLHRTYFGWLNEAGARFAGGLSLVPYVEAIRADARERLPEELRTWEDLLRPAPDVGGVAAIESSFVKAWSEEELRPHLERAAAGRDFERGRIAFAKATCAECHRVGGEGGATGPDLTGAGSRFSAGDLLTAILRPSETISDQYQETEVLTVNGIVHVGRIAGEDGETLTLAVRAPVEEELVFDLAEIESRRPSPVSRMPSGLLDVLELEEILDLVAYTLAGGRADDAAFR